MAYLQYPANCPKCGYELSRSRRRGLFERTIFRLLMIKAFRCHRCTARYCAPPAIVFSAWQSGETDHHGGRSSEHVETPQE